MQDALPGLVFETRKEAHVVQRISNCFFLRQVVEHIRCCQLLAQLIELALICRLNDEHVDGKSADLLVSVSLDAE